MRSLTLLPVPQPRLVHRRYIFLATLQVFDVATTGWILHHFASASEANPIVKAIFTSTGLALGLSILLALKLGMVYLLWTCQTGIKIASFIYGAVVVNNLLFLVLWMLR